MHLRPCSGNSITLTGTSRFITREDSNQSHPSCLGKLITGGNKLNNTLEEVIDVEKDLELYSSHQLNLLNPQILYQTNALNFNTQLLRINREEEILVTTESKNLTLVSTESIKKIKQSGKKLVHLGFDSALCDVL